MKLSGIGLFVIVLISLLLGMLTNNVVEGLTGNKEKPVDKKEKQAHLSAEPHGIPRSQIPVGDEHLYILKSQIVPPVCPACPQNTSCPREKPCPPCPPCARCPEPAFDCKKVPNYQSSNEQYLPKPILSDFSSF